MEQRTLTLGHSPDPDDAFMFYALAKDLIPTHGFRFEHILQDIQTLNERATRGELDISAISIHAYAHVSATYALLPSGASMGDGYGPMLVAKRHYSRDELARQDFEGGLAVELQVVREINLAHAARTQRAFDSVVPEDLTDECDSETVAEWPNAPVCNAGVRRFDSSPSLE